MFFKEERFKAVQNEGAKKHQCSQHESKPVSQPKEKQVSLQEASKSSQRFMTWERERQIKISKAWEEQQSKKKREEKGKMNVKELPDEVISSAASRLFSLGEEKKRCKEEKQLFFKEKKEKDETEQCTFQPKLIAKKLDHVGPKYTEQKSVKRDSPRYSFKPTINRNYYVPSGEPNVYKRLYAGDKPRSLSPPRKELTQEKRIPPKFLSFLERQKILTEKHEEYLGQLEKSYSPCFKPRLNPKTKSIVNQIQLRTVEEQLTLLRRRKSKQIEKCPLDPSAHQHDKVARKSSFRDHSSRCKENGGGVGPVGSNGSAISPHHHRLSIRSDSVPTIQIHLDESNTLSNDYVPPKQSKVESRMKVLEEAPDHNLDEFRIEEEGKKESELGSLANEAPIKDFRPIKSTGASSHIQGPKVDQMTAKCAKIFYNKQTEFKRKSKNHHLSEYFEELILNFGPEDVASSCAELPPKSLKNVRIRSSNQMEVQSPSRKQNQNSLVSHPQQKKIIEKKTLTSTDFPDRTPSNKAMRRRRIEWDSSPVVDPHYKQEYERKNDKHTQKRVNKILKKYVHSKRTLNESEDWVEQLDERHGERKRGTLARHKSDFEQKHPFRPKMCPKSRAMIMGKTSEYARKTLKDSDLDQFSEKELLAMDIPATLEEYIELHSSPNQEEPKEKSKQQNMKRRQGAQKMHSKPVKLRTENPSNMPFSQYFSANKSKKGKNMNNTS